MPSNQQSNIRDIIRDAKDLLSANIPRYIDDWLPGGKRIGHEYTVRNPNRTDKNAGSFSINLDTGVWSDFATGDSGDILGLYAYLHGLKQGEAAKEVSERYGAVNGVANDNVPKSAVNVENEQIILPVPDNAPDARKMRTHIYRGDEGKREITHYFEYRDTAGRLMGYTARAEWEENGEKKKDIRPLTLWRDEKNRLIWKFRTFPKPRPLYGLDLLSANPDARVLLVEGEKKCDEARKALSTKGWVVLSVFGGAEAVKYNDLSPLRGREVVCWPDNDTPGISAMQYVANTVGARVMQLPPDIPKGGWDISDALTGEIDDIEEFIEDCLYNRISAVSDDVPANDNATPTMPDGINIPYEWEVSVENGIVNVIEKKGVINRIPVCPNAAIISKVLKNIDTKEEKLEISFMKYGRWNTAVYPRQTVMNKSTVIKLTSHGMQFTSESAKQMVYYLDKYDVVNNIPLMRSTDRMGWVGKGRFFPYVDDIIYEKDADIGIDFGEITKPRGDYNVWKEVIGAERKLNYSFRFLMAASFASPLVSLLRYRVFFVHMWGDSKSGKTASLKAALSVWGNPEPLMRTFNSTAVGLEHMCGVLRHMPFGIDERQMLNKKKFDTENIIYTLAEGTGRTRGNKQGGLQRIRDWENIIITTGEEPLTSDSSMQGAKTRTIELHSKPFDDVERAMYMHQMVKVNHGLAGRDYINGLAGRDYKQDYEQMCGYLRTICTAESYPTDHLSNIAVICLGDMYASMSIWGADYNAALDAACDMAIEVFKQLNSEDNADTVDKAWEFVQGWIASNARAFSNNASVEMYGGFEGQEIFVIKHIMDKALTEAGYSPAQAVKGFLKRGYIIPFVDYKKINRASHRKGIMGAKVSVYVMSKGYVSAEKLVREMEERENRQLRVAFTRDYKDEVIN